MDPPAVAGLPLAVTTGVAMGVLTTFYGLEGDVEPLVWTGVSVAWILLFLSRGGLRHPVTALAKRMAFTGVFTGLIQWFNYDTYRASNPWYEAEAAGYAEAGSHWVALAQIGGGVGIGAVWGALTGLALLGAQRVTGIGPKSKKA
uniref:Uncharacterized protein n=1 Tax=Bicosoecida sp. CB-2014 TaxID=1486930 RepID=A0A7S1CIT9_9STRA